MMLTIGRDDKHYCDDKNRVDSDDKMSEMTNIRKCCDNLCPKFRKTLSSMTYITFQSFLIYKKIKPQRSLCPF